MNRRYRLRLDGVARLLDAGAFTVSGNGQFRGLFVHSGTRAFDRVVGSMSFSDYGRDSR
jgi:hypothetical protein